MGSCKLRKPLYVKFPQCILHQWPFLALLWFDCLMVFDVTGANGPGWSRWSDLGPCGANCKKYRQRYCTSTNKDVHCPGHSNGVETEERVCPHQECYG